MRRLITYLILLVVVVVVPAVYIYVSHEDESPFKDRADPATPAAAPARAKPDHGDFEHRFQPKPPDPSPSVSQK